MTDQIRNIAIEEIPSYTVCLQKINIRCSPNVGPNVVPLSSRCNYSLRRLSHHFVGLIFTFLIYKYVGDVFAKSHQPEFSCSATADSSILTGCCRNVFQLPVREPFSKIPSPIQTIFFPLCDPHSSLVRSISIYFLSISRYPFFPRVTERGAAYLAVMDPI